jgi:endothelin-converting enzyme/putative endopeptidase
MRFRVFSAAIWAAISLLHCPAQSPKSADTVPKLNHIDVTHVDASADPCDNFYQYVCGKLNAENPIPADQIFWGPGGELRVWNQQVLRQILEKNQAPSAPRTPNEQKIGDFYASCMNQAGNRTNELDVIRPLLDRINGMHDKREIAGVLAALHSSFGQAWNGGDNQTAAPLFGYGPTPDFNDVSRVVAGLDQGGLGLPGRDFYLKTDDDSRAIRDKYVTFIEALLALQGESASDSAKDAAVILRLETAMAQAHMDNISRRDPNNLNNRYTLAQVKELVPALDWDSYLGGISAPAVPLYEVSAPEFFRTLNKLLAGEELATWKIYLRWHLLLGASPVLGNTWRKAQFAFLSALLGLKEQPPDWRRCTDATDQYLGQALGQVYVAQVFPPESKARAQKMVKDIEAAMGRDIDAVTWMQTETKRQAHLKLAAVVDKIGYPDKWIDYSSLSIEPSSYTANVERNCV